MTDNFEYKSDKSDNNELNDICDECKKEDEAVTQNLILTGYKLSLIHISEPTRP